MQFDQTERSYLIALFEKQRTYLEGLIAKLKQGDESVPQAVNAISDAIIADGGSQSHSTKTSSSRRRRSSASPEAGKGPKMRGRRKGPSKVPKKKRYMATQHEVITILQDADSALTAFKIGEQLKQRFNIQIREDDLSNLLKNALEHGRVSSPRQGEYLPKEK